MPSHTSPTSSANGSESGELRDVDDNHAAGSGHSSGASGDADTKEVAGRSRAKRTRLWATVAIAVVAVAAAAPFAVAQYTLYKTTDVLESITSSITASTGEVSAERAQARDVLSPVYDEHEETLARISDLADAHPTLVTSATLDDVTEDLAMGTYPRGGGDWFSRFPQDLCRATADRVKIPFMHAAAVENCNDYAAAHRELEQRLLHTVVLSDFKLACQAKFETFDDSWPEEELEGRKAYAERGALYIYIEPAREPAFPEQDDKIHDILADVDADVDAFVSRDHCLAAFPSLSEPTAFNALP